MRGHFGNREISQPSSAFHRKPLLHGVKRVVSNAHTQPVDIVDISIKSQRPHLVASVVSHTPASPQENKRTTWAARFPPFMMPTPTLMLSKTSVPVSTSSARVFAPFWTPSLEETYRSLWSPTEIACAASDSTFWPTSSQGSEPGSKYCQIRAARALLPSLQPTSYQSLQFSPQDITAPESTVYTRKIRIYPHHNQIVLFNKCLGASRFFFNKANALLERASGRNLTFLLSLGHLRPLVMKSDSDIAEGDVMNWQKEVPYDTRQGAIADAITAYKSALTNLARGNIDHFDVAFRSKKTTRSQAFHVSKAALNPTTLQIFKTRLGKRASLRLRRRDRKKFFNLSEGLGEVTCDFQIIKTRPDKWYICLPRKQPRVARSCPIYDTPTYKSVFLDPGVRTFQTFYSPDGVCGKIGGDLNNELKKLDEKHDRLWSLSDSSLKSEYFSKTKRNLRKRCSTLRAKIQGKVDDLHWQTCAFLCRNFENIFLPRFEVSQMVLGSPLGSKITRKMLQLSHGKFRERLKWYAASRGRNLQIVTEEYTTKTCGRCGVINNHVGGNHTFRCGACALLIDRDYGAARNICLKVVTDCLKT